MLSIEMSKLSDQELLDKFRDAVVAENSVRSAEARASHYTDRITSEKIILARMNGTATRLGEDCAVPRQRLQGED